MALVHLPSSAISGMSSTAPALSPATVPCFWRTLRLRELLLGSHELHLQHSSYTAPLTWQQCMNISLSHFQEAWSSSRAFQAGVTNHLALCNFRWIMGCRFSTAGPHQAVEPASNPPWSPWARILGLKCTEWKKLNMQRNRRTCINTSKRSRGTSPESAIQMKASYCSSSSQRTAGLWPRGPFWGHSAERGSAPQGRTDSCCSSD